MEFEAFVQIDSPQIEIHPMNFKTELRSRKRLTNKVLFNFLFFYSVSEPLEAQMCKVARN